MKIFYYFYSSFIENANYKFTAPRNIIIARNCYRILLKLLFTSLILYRQNTTFSKVLLVFACFSRCVNHLAYLAQGLLLVARSTTHCHASEAQSLCKCTFARLIENLILAWKNKHLTYNQNIPFRVAFRYKSVQLCKTFHL